MAFVDEIRAVRRALRDKPPRTRIADVGGINASVQTITLPAGDAGRLFPTAGAMLECDDSTDERILVTATDEENEQISVLRAQDGTTGAAHLENAGLFVDPRFEYSLISETLTSVVDDEMWPHVWLVGETSLTYETDAHYSPVASDIEDVVFVYQIVASEKYRLDFEWLSKEMVDNTNFPNGMLIVDEPADSSTLYVSYKVKPTTASLGTLGPLARLGTQALLMMFEEGRFLSPDAAAVDRRIREGAKARSGQQLWTMFIERRMAKRIALLEAEEAFLQFTTAKT